MSRVCIIVCLVLLLSYAPSAPFPARSSLPSYLPNLVCRSPTNCTVHNALAYLPNARTQPGILNLLIFVPLTRFGEALEVYGAQCTHVRASAVGGRPSLEAIMAALDEKPYKMITITHVDTSTGVLMDVEVGILCRRSGR
jgi:hypothetical protein